MGITTIQDSLAWLDKNPEAIKFGNFIDIYNLCILVVKEVNGETDYCKKMQQTVQKLGLGNPQEVEALLAFQSTIPDLFADGGKGVYGKNKSAFSPFPKLKYWKANCGRFSSTISMVCFGPQQSQIDMHVLSSSPVNCLLKLAVYICPARSFRNLSLGLPSPLKNGLKHI